MPNSPRTDPGTAFYPMMPNHKSTFDGSWKRSSKHLALVWSSNKSLKAFLGRPIFSLASLNEQTPWSLPLWILKEYKSNLTYPLGGKNKKFLRSLTNSRDLYLAEVLARPSKNWVTLSGVTNDGLKNISPNCKVLITLPYESVSLKGALISGWPSLKAAEENSV